jgi:RNA polymerase sigma factor (sigma-70 family)
MIDQKKYNRWLNYANVICGNKDKARDVLQEFCLKILEKETPEDKLNDNYVFISLRNTWLSMTKINNKFSFETPPETLQDEDIDHEFIYSTIKEKHQVIEEVLNSLQPYERQLYVLHFIYGISQREIGRETGIGIGPIFKRIKKIKTKINENYKKKFPEEK